MRSWGGLPEQQQRLIPVRWRDELAGAWTSSTLAVGCSRSYGDSGLAASGEALSTRSMNRVLAFDRDNGVLSCEAGVTLAEILRLTLPVGWILPVLPGTQFVTIAGAIANDIHGKNHHHAGTFGRHVRRLQLQRSNGEVIECSEQDNSDWFAATIAGLGLTGVILQAELQLKPVAGPWLATESIKFGNLEEFFALSEESDQSHEYTVAWVDCLSRDCRGHFSRAVHSRETTDLAHSESRLSVPFALPVSPVNAVTLRVFNSVYYHRQRPPRRSARASLYDWFFPLDRIANWNRLYGKRGFRQYQCVVPEPVIAELMSIIRQSGQGSFLAVLKKFGSVQSPGLLSFPRGGATLALDFPWRGQRTLDLFKQLDKVVDGNNGAIYAAKDAHMSGAHFRRAYPAWETVERLRDPQLMSLLWQRVTGDT